MTPSADGEIAVPRETLLGLARLLERWVVSEDRIGAAYANRPVGDSDHAAGRWYRESGILRDASARRADVLTLLGHYVPIEDDDVERVEAERDREFADIAYWAPPTTDG